MDEDISERWKSLSLSKIEWNEIIIQDSLWLNTKFQAEHCFFKLLSNKSFNREAFETMIMKNIWKPSKGFHIYDMCENIFFVGFFAKGDKERVMRTGPWTLDKSLVVMQKMMVVFSFPRHQYLLRL